MESEQNEEKQYYYDVAGIELLIQRIQVSIDLAKAQKVEQANLTED